MNKKVYFITGIDTGCGKTYATGHLGKALLKTGINVITQKLVQTGCSGISEDILEHRRIMECGFFPEDKDGTTCPYVFSKPASPHLAAKLEMEVIKADKLTSATMKLSGKYDIVLVEGAGGLHVPLNSDLLTIDYIRMQDYPVILVSSSKIGSINHTLLSIESCFTHHINLHAVIYNRLPGDDEIVADETFRIIKRTLDKQYPYSILAEMGLNNDYEKLTELFND